MFPVPPQSDVAHCRARARISLPAIMSNFLLHKHCKPDEQFRRPEGLTELLCDITREVLREQPDCVYTFCADYLDAMLRTREQTLSE